MIYDIVLCVSSIHVGIAIKAIHSLHHFLQPREVFVVTSPQNFARIRNRLKPSASIQLLDEDQLIENVNLGVIQEILERRIDSSERAGWYFQQFLKMAICTHSDVADHYLIWDSDTLLLRPIELFDETERVLINPRTEHHKPYFELTKRVLGFDRQVEFSFVSEHFMINKTYMSELVSALTEKASDGSSWVDLILNSIEKSELPFSGFSEYETYGNFIALRYKSSFACRSLRTMRTGAKLYGTHPGRSDIYRLIKSGYETASFEKWESVSRKQITVNKAKSLFHYWLGRVCNPGDSRLQDAGEISR